MSELINFFYLSWRKSSTYVSTQEAEEVAYLCVTTSCITTSCTCKRLGVYVSQPLVPVRGWVSMHPNLLHLQEVVAARCLSILSFSTPPFAQHTVSTLLVLLCSDSITSSYPCLNTKCLPETSE
jgi:hypothetical protein